MTMAGAWILRCGLLLCFIVLVFANREDDKSSISVLKQLKDEFVQFRKADGQYAVLYAPEPNKVDQISYVPPVPQTSVRGAVLHPPLNRGDTEYAHNYAFATPDYGCRAYGNMLTRRRLAIHTEDLLLNLVVPKMKPWYKRQFTNDLKLIYLYTYALPCPKCDKRIQAYVRENRDLTIIIGYTVLHTTEDQTPEDNKKLEERRDRLRTFMKQNRGKLLEVEDSGRGASRRA